MMISNVLILPSKGIYLQDSENLYEDSFLCRFIKKRRVILPENLDFKIDFNLDKLNTLDEAYYAGWKLDHFGHFLLESLSRLYNVKQSKTKNIVWLSRVKNDSLLDWQIYILHLLGIYDGYNHVIVNKTIGVKSIIVNKPGYVIANIFTPKHVEFLSVYKSKNIIPGRKIWLSKSKLSDKMGGWSNEKEIEDELINLGWDIIHPQEHSISDQLEILSSAEIIAGVEGSAFHLLILISNIKSKIILFSRGSYVHKNYKLIEKAKELNQLNIVIRQKIVGNAENKYLNRYLVDKKEFLKTIEIISSKTEHMLEYEINLIRNIAISLESIDIKASYELMKIVKRLRPNGSRINQKFKLYSKLLLNEKDEIDTDLMVKTGV